ncbi:coilin isoform X2 [Corythoichthys intestinalis]|uniref:coilin isoform X2 n=1 Tax=Corythoichthys intestinalis TaxID=161448 RepID=UPI0025A54A5B|nr:coilin isoform X2 [Corythoichthys intestinalis]
MHTGQTTYAVKVECVPHLDGHNHNPNTSQNCKKRRRQSLSEPNNSGEDATCLNKKIKKKSKEILKVDTSKILGVETNGLKKKTSKKKRKKENGFTTTDQPTLSTPQIHKDYPKEMAHKSKSQTLPSSNSNKHKSVEDEVPNKRGTQRDSPVAAKVQHPSKVLPRTRPVKNCSSSSSSDLESPDEGSTDSSKHKSNDLTNHKSSLNHNLSSKLSNCGPKKHSSVSTAPIDKIPKSLESNDTNISEKADVVTRQNDTESASRDYSAMPLLAAPPQVGQKIAFKQLELTENYTPEVSAYKEAMIVSFDPITKQVELELLSVAQAPSEPGKFDLVYQNPDGSELVEYAVSRESRVAERWDSLLEPRLII